MRTVKKQNVANNRSRRHTMGLYMSLWQSWSSRFTSI